MKITVSSILAFYLLTSMGNYPNADEILRKVDQNMSSKTQVIESKMIIWGKRNNREVTSKGYSEGSKRSFTEYLSPERDRGTKMLKLNDKLWIYSPETDRTIQLSGHMLRQSVMGSDLSYEDMMENRKLTDIYSAKVLEEEIINERKTWVLELVAKVEKVTYHKRKIWVDQERYVPLKEELYAKSGQLLKKTMFLNIKKIGNRWYPSSINYKDMLKDGKGTDFIILSVKFDEVIPDYIFSKASLKK